MKGKAVPKNNLSHRLEGYEFRKDKKYDKVYWVDHFTYCKSNPSEIYPVLGELLVSFDHHKILNLWCDYPWKFTPEQKVLFDKENPYWADFFKRRNGTEPPIVDENGVGTIHFND